MSRGNAAVADQSFADVILADPEFVLAEFEEIVAANFGAPLDPPPAGEPRPDSCGPSPRRPRAHLGAWPREQVPAASALIRERSPPPERIVRTRQQ
jgi:hypothetical protein